MAPRKQEHNLEEDDLQTRVENLEKKLLELQTQFSKFRPQAAKPVDPRQKLMVWFIMAALLVLVAIIIIRFGGGN